MKQQTVCNRSHYLNLRLPKWHKIKLWIIVSVKKKDYILEKSIVNKSSNNRCILTTEISHFKEQNKILIWWHWAQGYFLLLFGLIKTTTGKITNGGNTEPHSEMKLPVKWCESVYCGSSFSEINQTESLRYSNLSTDSIDNLSLHCLLVCTPPSSSSFWKEPQCCRVQSLEMKQSQSQTGTKTEAYLFQRWRSRTARGSFCFL